MVGTDFSAVWIDQYLAAAIIQDEGVVAGAGIDKFPVIFVAPTFDTIAIPQAGQITEMTD